MRIYAVLIFGVLLVSGCVRQGERVADIPSRDSDYILIMPLSGALYDLPVREIDASTLGAAKRDIYIDLERSQNPPEKIDQLMFAVRNSTASTKAYDKADEGCRSQSVSGEPICLTSEKYAGIQLTYWNMLGSFKSLAVC